MPRPRRQRPLKPRLRQTARTADQVTVELQIGASGESLPLTASPSGLAVTHSAGAAPPQRPSALSGRQRGKNSGRSARVPVQPPPEYPRNLCQHSHRTSGWFRRVGKRCSRLPDARIEMLVQARCMQRYPDLLSVRQAEILTVARKVEQILTPGNHACGHHDIVFRRDAPDPNALRSRREIPCMGLQHLDLPEKSRQPPGDIVARISGDPPFHRRNGPGRELSTTLGRLARPNGWQLSRPVMSASNDCNWGA